MYLYYVIMIFFICLFYLFLVCKIFIFYFMYFLIERIINNEKSFFVYIIKILKYIYIFKNFFICVFFLDNEVYSGYLYIELC